MKLLSKFVNLFISLQRRRFTASSRLGFKFYKRQFPFDPYYDNSVYGDKPRILIGGKYVVPMLPGAGVGPELTAALESVFLCTGVPVTFETIHLDPESPEEVYQEFLMMTRLCGCCVKAFVQPPLDPPPKTHLVSRNMRIRKDLRLYASVTHYKSQRGITHRWASERFKNMVFDIFVIRQNIEGEYSMLTHEPVPGVIEELKVCSRFYTEKLAKFAFKFAEETNKKRVVTVRVSGGTQKLFLDTISKEAKNHPNIEFHIYRITDAIDMILKNPKEFDVIVSESLYGGVLSSCLAAFIGTLGVMSGTNIGDKYACFEPAARKRLKSIAGKGIVNPVGILNCGVNLLRFLELNNYAKWMSNAINDTMEKDQIYTPDAGGKHTTTDFVNNVIARMRKAMPTANRQCFLDEIPKLPPLPKSPTAPFSPKIHMPQIHGEDFGRDPLISGR